MDKNIDKVVLCFCTCQQPSTITSFKLVVSICVKNELLLGQKKHILVLVALPHEVWLVVPFSFVILPFCFWNYVCIVTFKVICHPSLTF